MCIPVVNILHDVMSTFRAVNMLQVFANPGDKVVFEGTFDKLMKQVR
jgi:hypothetical protein